MVSLTVKYSFLLTPSLNGYMHEIFEEKLAVFFILVSSLNLFIHNICNFPIFYPEKYVYSTQPKEYAYFPKNSTKCLHAKQIGDFASKEWTADLKTNVGTTYGILLRCKKLPWGFQNGDSYKRSLLCLKRLFVVLGNPRDFGSTSWKPDSGVALAFFLLCV